MKKRRMRTWLPGGALGLWLFLSLGSGPAGAKDPDYPTKPINFLIGFAAGGAGDLGSRALLDSAAKYLGQPFVPINRPGAGASLAALAVMNAKADGYTLGYVSASPVFVAPFAQDAPYKDLSGFTMIMNFGSTVYPLAVRGDAPWKTWKEFIAWARKNPRAAKMGIAGGKTVVSTGLALWQVELREQVEFTFIPQKGTSEILPATLGGHITAFGGTLDGSVMQYIRDGSLRILTYLGTQKVPGHENVPSLQELYGFSIPDVAGVMGPKGLPDYVLKKLDEAFAKAVKDPDFLRVMSRLHLPAVYMDRAQITRYVEETFPKISQTMKTLRAQESKK